MTISDVLPDGLTPTAANNGTINGWSVSTNGQTVTATRSDVLDSGNSYPNLTVTVAVSATAPANVTNTATVSGGGELNAANNSASDPTSVVQIADLTITKSHGANFVKGAAADAYTIVVRNTGALPTTGMVIVTDVLPDGLTPTAANTGTINGWAVSTNGQTITAARDDALAGGTSYAALIVTVAVAGDAPDSVINTATVSGGGELNTANNSASDPTTISAPGTAPPVSSVNPLPPVQDTAEVALSWSGQPAAGSTIAFFDIFVSDNGGPFTAFFTGTTQTSAIFVGQNGHTYGFYSVATDNFGNRQPTPTEAQATVEVQLPPVTVGLLDEQPGGFTIEFSVPIDASSLNLYDQGGTLGPADVSVVEALTGPVAGSLVVGADHITFIRTGGPLAPDTYTVVLRSGTNGFKDTTGDLLDGNGDGTAGDNYTETFTVTPLPVDAVIVSVPDISRGFGQPVNEPASATGLPIILSTGRNVSHVDVTLHFDPELLTISGVVPDSFPAGATATVNLDTPGQADITVSTTGEFSSIDGPITLIRLIAQVPDTAVYGGKQILDLTNPEVHDSGNVMLDSFADDGVHVAAYFGDANGDRQYNAPDAILTQRVIVQINSGFLLYPLADPKLLSDITFNGELQGNDVTSIQRAIVQIPVANIPPLPTDLTPPASVLDPHLFVPAGLAGAVGITVTVPIVLTVTEPVGISLGGGEVVLSYDPEKLVVSNVRLGSLLSGFTASFDGGTPGRVVFSAWSVEGTGFLPLGLTGTLFLMDVTVKSGTAPGPTPLNLQAASALFDDELQELLLIPTLTDGWDDQVDAMFAVLGD